MANPSVFESGYNEGLQIAARQRARKEAQPEANLQEQHDEYTKIINALQTKYPSLLGPNKEQTPDSLRAQYALTQALVQRAALQKQPQGAVAHLGGKIGELLHLKKKPEAQSVTTQSAGVSLPAATPVTSNAEDAYRQVTAQPAAAGAPTASAASAPATPAAAKTMVVPNPKGLVEAGNISITDRPRVQNADGSHSSEYSVSFRDNQGHEVLVPTVVDGKFLTPDGKKPPQGSPEEKAMFHRAWENYLKTGQNLGKFDNAANADAYATVLHNREQAAPAPATAPQSKTLAALREEQRRLAPTHSEQAPPLTPNAFSAPAMAGSPARAVTVQGPALSLRQLREQAKVNQRAQQEASLLLEAAPLTPTQEAVQAARAAAAGKTESVRSGLAAIKEFHPDASPEELEKLNNEYLDTVLGTREKTTFKPLSGSKPYQSTDGRYYQLMQDSLTGEITHQELPEGYKPPPDKVGTSKFAMNVDSYKRAHGIAADQPLTPEQLNFVEQQIALSSAAPSSSVTNTLKQNFEGFWVPIQETNRRIPGFGYILADPMGQGSRPVAGAGPSTSSGVSANTAAPARAATTPRPAHASETRSGSVRVGGPLFAAPNKDYTDLKSQYEGAERRVKTMDNNLREASNGDQQAMLSLVANHIGMTLGAQKGARINQAVWNEAVASAPWLASIVAKWGPDGYLKGVTLTKDQMQSMVKLAHEQRDIFKESLEQKRQELTAPQGGGAAPAAPAAGGDKALADRLARALGGG
jgi:hypothetical protein